MKRPVKRLKYGNTKIVVEGFKFDSLKEAKRWGELKLLERAGQIASLERQVRIKMIVNGALVCTWVPDFRYVENGETVVEDVKSPITRKEPVYRIKVKLAKALHGIEVRET